MTNDVAPIDERRLTTPLEENLRSDGSERLDARLGTELYGLVLGALNVDLLKAKREETLERLIADEALANASAVDTLDTLWRTEQIKEHTDATKTVIWRIRTAMAEDAAVDPGAPAYRDLKRQLRSFEGIDAKNEYARTYAVDINDPLAQDVIKRIQEIGRRCETDDGTPAPLSHYADNTDNSWKRVTSGEVGGYLDKNPSSIPVGSTKNTQA